MSTATVTPAEAEELAVVTRSGFIESRHLGVGVAITAQGEIAASIGTPDRPVVSRSCLKPVQALTAMRLGADLSGPAAVLATASHRAEARHVEVVESMLSQAGLTAAQLGCPAVLPGDPGHRQEVLASGGQASPLFFNCSGKHTAFLMACRAQGWSLEDYLDPAHPLQLAIAETIVELTGSAPEHIGIDGCGAPVFTLPLTHLARAVGAIAAGTEAPASTLMEAVLAHPWAIEGTERPNTLVIEELGVLAKFGAEGVMVMATREGAVAAVKSLDGSSRATTLTGLALLAAAGGVEAQALGPVWQRAAPRITGGEAIVGAVQPGEGLLRAVPAGVLRGLEAVR